MKGIPSSMFTESSHTFIKFQINFSVKVGFQFNQTMSTRNYFPPPYILAYLCQQIVAFTKLLPVRKVDAVLNKTTHPQKPRRQVY